jgi:ubiquinol-cytochrome c reductase iron-sulfur subunit
MEEDRRRFISILTTLMAGFGIAASAVPFLSILKPNPGKLRELASLVVDLAPLVAGESMVVAWQNKPIWIIRRTQMMLDTLTRIHPLLRDPNSLVQQQPDYVRNEYRSLNPEYFIVVGICTHLGCSPQYKPEPGELNATWPGGFFCPCHGSTFDLAGRVMKGVPAPVNLEIPPYRFINAHTISLGEDPSLF